MNPRIPLWPLLFCALALGACSLHAPQPIAPPAPMPEAFVEAHSRESGAPVPERWWESFGDERLDLLMAEAFAANLDLAQAYARLDQADAVARTARASRLPSLGLEGSGGKLRQSTFLGPETTESYRLSAAAAFELDLWRKNASRASAARLDARAAEADVRTAYLSLSARVADLYYLAVEQRAQLELADRSIAAFSDTVERVERRYREGLVPALDLYQSRQNLSAARARRPQFENSLAATEHALAVLLGRYPDGGATGELVELPSLEQDFPTGLPSRLLASRPDIEAALLRLKGSDERIAAAIAERFPSFNLVGSYGGNSTEIGDLFQSGNIFWSLLLNLAQPVIDGGRRSAEVDRNRALFRENLARYHQAVLTAFREVEDALAATRTTEERIARLGERVEASRAALRLSLDNYLQGLSEYLPVLTAQGLLFDAESQLLASRRQLVADRISLARALGGNWMRQEMARKD